MSPSRGPGISTVTAHLRRAVGNADWQFLGEALHPQVHWSAPRPGARACRGRSRVLSRCARLHTRLSGVTVEETFMYPGAIVLGLWLRLGTSTPDSDGLGCPVSDELVYQVLDVVDGLVVRITGYTDRTQALTAAYDGPAATF
ncbi:hypothetical protein ACH41H_31715 [Streptomyces sp. NPDC020800]|uniref:hypothetical protein n=1 Tax=Streptomyces sp. NPDC020800 TaxID=3365092 RepID=UPI0037AEFF75